MREKIKYLEVMSVNNCPVDSSGIWRWVESCDSVKADWSRTNPVLQSTHSQVEYVLRCHSEHSYIANTLQFPTFPHHWTLRPASPPAFITCNILRFNTPFPFSCLDPFAAFIRKVRRQLIRNCINPHRIILLKLRKIFQQFIDLDFTCRPLFFRQGNADLR